MTSEISKNYDPKEIESRLFDAWYEAGYFHRDNGGCANLDLSPYTVVIPPPNVTGQLHMGHALNETIQDTCVRRARMQGHPTRWIVGTDHAGIATQNKVEQKIAQEGKTRFDLGREKFIEECWAWRRQYGSTIIEQLKGMGCSCDYDDEQFTMDSHYQDAIRKVFVEWYRAGLIYRGNRIINWCPRCTTALADDEVEHQDEQGHLWYLRYPLKEPIGDISYVTVATTRPETMLGDTAVAVNPHDDRYVSLVGTTVILPIVGREVPLIADEYVDCEFGTGFVKMTPAHDPNDYEVGKRHNLAYINIFTPDGHINENGGAFEGMDRFEARGAVVDQFEELGLLDHVEDHAHAVGHCYRCGTTIEPWLSDQWFVDMKPIAAPAIQAVRDGRVVFHPRRWEHVYFQWMENIRDWCISRQLWWGHRIPVFYCDTCGWTDASIEDITLCPKCGAVTRQDEDVLDTWFSSQLWPFATMGWPNVEGELNTCYPTQVLSTARDIIFLWVARMIMSSLYFIEEEIPFNDVIIHPTVLDKLGRRMSKSLGNGVDPLQLIDDFGADGMRFGLLLQVTGTQDMKFDEKKLEGSRNFATKIWNAARFVLMNLEDFEVPTDAVKPAPITDADKWILSRLARLTLQLDSDIDGYDFGAAARGLYNFFWNEFCDWYIEFSKGRLAEGGAVRAATQRNLVFILDTALRLLHPMMPFVTEEIWGRVPHGDTARHLMIASWPQASELVCFIDEEAERSTQLVIEAIVAARATRARYGLSPRETLSLTIKAQPADVLLLAAQSDLLKNMGRLSDLVIAENATKPSHAAAVISEDIEIFIALEGLVDFGAERIRLEKELKNLSGQITRVNAKLSSEGFLAKAAPEAIEKSRADAESLGKQIARIEEQLKELG